MHCKNALQKCIAKKALQKCFAKMLCKNAMQNAMKIVQHRNAINAKMQFKTENILQICSTKLLCKIRRVNES
jgi:hypothetical protein